MELSKQKQLKEILDQSLKIKNSSLTTLTDNEANEIIDTYTKKKQAEEIINEIFNTKKKKMIKHIVDKI